MKTLFSLVGRAGFEPATNGLKARYALSAQGRSPLSRACMGRPKQRISRRLCQILPTSQHHTDEPTNGLYTVPYSRDNADLSRCWPTAKIARAKAATTAIQAPRTGTVGQHRDCSLCRFFAPAISPSGRALAKHNTTPRGHPEQRQSDTRNGTGQLPACELMGWLKTEAQGCREGYNGSAHTVYPQGGEAAPTLSILVMGKGGCRVKLSDSQREDLMQKTCKKCGESKSADCFYRRSKSPDGLQNRCKPCQHVDSAERGRKDPKRRNQIATAWKKRNPEKQRQYIREWALRDYHANKDKWRARQAQYYEKIKDELSDGYVAGLIAKRAGCQRKDVPQAMVAAKRSHLQVKRLIRKESEK